MTFPKGVRKAIDLYQEKIEAVAGGWVDWKNPLGCGSYGCVFPLWTKDVSYDKPGDQARPLDRVLKISTDPTEGPVVSAIMKTGLDKRLNGLARWYGVWRIPEPIQKGPRGTGWIIVREEVRPYRFNDYSSGGFSRRTNWIDKLRDYNKFTRQGLKAKTERGREKNFDEAQHAISQLYNDQGTYSVAEAVESLRREDIILADIHQGNLGTRIHPTEDQPLQMAWWEDQKERPPLLIFDPGHSSAPKDTTVEDLWATAGAANPWMGGEAREIEVL